LHSLVRARIDTAALRHNLGVARARAPGAAVMAAVKANAYGHGLIDTARTLAAADGFAVARLDEALALRAAGIGQRILLLEGVFSPDGLALAAQQRFDVMVHSLEQVAMLEANPGTRSLNVWLKLDTGMNRLGLRPEAFTAAHARLQRIASVIEPPVLTTHLACADDRDDAMTARQLQLFSEVTRDLPGARSIANSAGLLGWPGARGDWVRPGLMLYGVAPFIGMRGAQLELRPVMTLQSEVIAVKQVPTGETVGYGGVWRAERPTRMAVVAAGYGDGYPRGLPAGTPVLVKGCRAALIGRVSMDMITVDVTDIPPVASGDPVVLWGEAIPVEEIAALAGRIPYELLCAVTERVPHEFS
jgi:alanine racemase